VTTTTENKRKISVFIASPSDLEAERTQFRETIAKLNAGFGDGSQVYFEPLGWENVPATSGIRVQDAINELIDRSDIFILVLYRRWGQDVTDSVYSSYTEEEFNIAWKKYLANKSPEIFVFFKQLNYSIQDENDLNLSKVLEFKKKLDSSGKFLYHTFQDLSSFEKLVDKHLRVFAKGETPRAQLTSDDRRADSFDSDPSETIIPARLYQNIADHANVISPLYIGQLEQAIKQGKQEKAYTSLKRISDDYCKYFTKRNSKSGESEILLAQLYFHCGILADSLFKPNDAFQYFSKSIKIDSNNPEYLKESGIAALNLGNYKKAEELINKSIAHCNDLDKNQIAEAKFVLANMHHELGEASKAELLFKESSYLAENAEIVNRAFVAKIKSALALVYKKNGEQEAAESLYEDAIRLKLGIMDKNDPSIAVSLINLAELHQCMARYDKAVELTKKAIEIQKCLGVSNDLAMAMNRIAGIYRTLEEHKKSKNYCQQANRIFLDKCLIFHLRRAAVLDNMGLVYLETNEPFKAKFQFQKSLVIKRKHLNKDHEAYIISISNYARSLCDIGDLDKSEQILLEALNFFSRKHGKDHPFTTTTRNYLSYAKQKRGRFDEAELLYLETLKYTETGTFESNYQASIAFQRLSIQYNRENHIEKSKELQSKFPKNYKITSLRLAKIKELARKKEEFEIEPAATIETI